MKKTTGIVFVLAAALAAFVYFYDLKHTNATPDNDNGADTSNTADANAKPVFSVLPSDVTSITIVRNGTTATFEKRPDGFYMTQPIATKADEATVGAVASEVSSERVVRTLTPTPEQMTIYGLTSPDVTIEFTAQKGAKHTLKLGNKDFSGTNVYAIVDGSKDVTLLSNAILTSSDKPVDEFRDQAVLHFEPNEATSLDLKNESGEIVAAKADKTWKLEKPRVAAADEPAILSFLSSVSTARVASFVDDASADLSKYGLANPGVTLRVDLSGGKTTELKVGKKDEGNYFAKVSSQPAVFRITDATYKVLEQKFFDLRDKQIMHVPENDAVRLDIRNGTQTATCVKGANGEWSAAAPPADSKSQPQPQSQSQPTNCPSMWGAIQDTRAQEIYDAPSGSISAQLAKPEAEATVTDKAGKKTTIDISAASGPSVYARSSEGPVVMKLDKQILSDLNPSGKSVHD